ncbi:hypothetical protein PIB30_063269 [Stylosanthes scabra]|uniref:Uncharacterized protein n=1 Tax=Stylosanthes scabra TaxID=79078 RepID=A0ABU6TMY8_9FABA|nr:hypothetical protein [Stylosanthes scabra]
MAEAEAEAEDGERDMRRQSKATRLGMGGLGWHGFTKSLHPAAGSIEIRNGVI